MNVPAPLTAAGLAFPEWDGFEEGDEEDIVEIARTTAIVSVYLRALESPLTDGDDDAVGEWFSRRFDDALGC